MMKIPKSVQVGAFVLVAGFVAFLLRLTNWKLFATTQNVAIVLGAVAVFLAVFGLIKKMNKTLLMSALGVAIVGAFTFILGLIGLKDNVTLFILFVVMSVVLLLYGVFKK